MNSTNTSVLRTYSDAEGEGPSARWINPRSREWLTRPALALESQAEAQLKFCCVIARSLVA